MEFQITVVSGIWNTNPDLARTCGSRGIIILISALHTDIYDYTISLHVVQLISLKHTLHVAYISRLHTPFTDHKIRFCALLISFTGE